VPTRARALTASCHLRNQFGDDSAVPALAREAIRIARDLGDDAIAADALSQLCWFRYEHGDLPAAIAQTDEAVGWPGRPRIPGWLPTFSSIAGRSQAKGTHSRGARSDFREYNIRDVSASHQRRGIRPGRRDRCRCG